MMRSMVRLGVSIALTGAAATASAEDWKSYVKIYGSDRAIKEMLPSYNLGGVAEPSREELAAMQKGQYILHARGGKLRKAPVEKVKLPHDPKGYLQRVQVAMAPDGSVFVSQGSLMCKSGDGGRTWNCYATTLQTGPNCSFKILSDGRFVAAQVTGDRDWVSVGSTVRGSRDVEVLQSRNEGRTWERISMVGGADTTACPVRYPDNLCRLPDDTLLLPIESRAWFGLNPLYVYRSTDGGKTWSGPTGQGPETTGFLSATSYETMIGRMASGKLLAVIRYHGPVVPHWPLI